MSIVTTSSKGQIVIPKTIRKQLGIKPGKKLSIKLENEKVIIQPLPDDPIEAFCGIFTGSPSLTKALLKERRKDQKRE